VLVAVARQMKTVNYMLSSQKCLEEGWTIRPPTPINAEDEEPEVFEPEPVDPMARVSVQCCSQMLKYPSHLPFSLNQS
jgi:hypothetical protein